MGEHTEVFVVGGGPAGLAAAIAARRKGFRVTVADAGEPPIDKACGEGLLPETVEALARLGVTIGASHGYAFRGIRFVSSGGVGEAEFPRKNAIGVRRTRLHQILSDAAADCGVRLRWNTQVTGIGDGEVLIDGKRVQARWIIGADGLQSRMRKWAGLDLPLRDERRFSCRGHFRVRPWTDVVEVYWEKGTQAYVTPVGAEEIGIAILSRDPQLRFADALQKFPPLMRRLNSAQPTSTARGAVTAMLRLRQVCRDRVALVGDASGAVDAITGEGLGLAFRQAEALAEALAAENLERYEVTHRRLGKRPAMMARLLLVLDRHEMIRQRAMRVLGDRPDLFAKILAVHIGKIPRIELVRTGLRVGWHTLFRGVEEERVVATASSTSPGEQSASTLEKP